MSDDIHLDPERHHTVSDLLDAGYKLDRVETSLSEALEWARGANLVFDGAGSVEGQINQARLAANLPLYAFKTSTPVPSSLRPLTVAPPKATSSFLPDGKPLQGLTVAKPGEVDMGVALQWAKAERITWNRTQPIIEQINDARKNWGLPPFRIKAKNALPADYVAGANLR